MIDCKHADCYKCIVRIDRLGEKSHQIIIQNSVGECIYTAIMGPEGWHARVNGKWDNVIK